MQAISITFQHRAARIRRADGIVIDSACSNDSVAFSAAELLAASLGSCLVASLVPLFARHGLDPGELEIAVADSGESVSDGFVIRVSLPSCTDDFEQRCRRAAQACPVKQALNVPLEIHWKVT